MIFAVLRELKSLALGLKTSCILDKNGLNKMISYLFTIMAIADIGKQNVGKFLMTWNIQQKLCLKNIVIIIT